jgi:hypothetical protein
MWLMLVLTTVLLLIVAWTPRFGLAGTLAPYA